MAKIKIYFCKAKWGDGHWLENAISAYTGLFNWGTGSYSHVELEDVQTHMMYTSTMRGDAKGVVKRPASEVLKKPGRWDVCEIECEQEDYELMITHADLMVKNNAGCDFKVAMSFFWFWRVHDASKYICSEAVNCWIGWLIRKWIGGDKCPSPRRLSRWLIKKGYKITPINDWNVAMTVKTGVDRDSFEAQLIAIVSNKYKLSLSLASCYYHATPADHILATCRAREQENG